jgi:GAF domain-containing protein
MASESPRGSAGDLATRVRQAEATVAEQAAEIALLRDHLADVAFADELHQALIRQDAAGQWAAPVVHNELLEMIVRTAARVLDARAATLFLVDYETDELVFGVAVGPGTADLKPFRVPLGAGIAGWAAATGQPVAVSDASQDPRFAAGVAQGIGYIPKSVLCIPLRSTQATGQIVVGVIEIFDKSGGQPFNANDMELLGQFASEAAVAIEQSRVVRDLTQLFTIVLQGLLPGRSEDDALQRALAGQADGLTGRTAQSEQYREALQITLLVSEVSRHGPRACQLCQQIVASLASYLRSQASLNAAGGWLR